MLEQFKVDGYGINREDVSVRSVARRLARGMADRMHSAGL